MPSYTIYAASTGDTIRSRSTTYSTARTGGSLTDFDDTEFLDCGQNRVSSNRDCYEAFLSWDLSSVAGSATVATISLYGYQDSSNTDFTLEARAHSWSAGGLTTADWVSGASLSGLTLLASRSTSGGFSTSGYNALTSEAALLTAVDAHGTLDVVFSSSRHRVGNDPSGNEFVGFYGDTSGTSQDAKIDITTVAAGNPWYYYAQLQ